MSINVQRYKADSRTIVGRLMPFFLRGKRMLRFMSAVCSPLDYTNKVFLSWARDTLVDAATTSQAIVLKWSLKNRLGKYFNDINDEFVIDTYDRSNYTTLYEDHIEQEGRPEVKDIYMPEDATETLDIGDNARVVIYDQNEITSESNEVRIIAPAHNPNISEEQYARLIKQYVETYLVYDIEYRIIISKN